jgi:hypothetical protein
MMKKILSSILFGATFGLMQTVQANTASTEYVNQHINDAVNTLTATFKSEMSRLATQINNQRIPTHVIGEIYQGGIVFFVDESGLHGLIAATHDANNGEGIQWQNGESGEKIVNARANGIGAGENNTRLIISQQTIDYQEGNFAALASSTYSVLANGATPCATTASSATACYGDWYLPSIYELDLMRRNLNGNYRLLSVPYWSSTEANVTESWAEDITSGTPILLDKSLANARVRAIRSF